MTVTRFSPYAEKLADVQIGHRVQIWHRNLGRHVSATVLDVKLIHRNRWDGTPMLEAGNFTVAWKSMESDGVRVATFHARAYSDDMLSAYAPETPCPMMARRDELLTALAAREYSEPNILVV